MKGLHDFCIPCVFDNDGNVVLETMDLKYLSYNFNGKYISVNTPLFHDRFSIYCVPSVTGGIDVCVLLAFQLCDKYSKPEYNPVFKAIVVDALQQFGITAPVIEQDNFTYHVDAEMPETLRPFKRSLGKRQRPDSSDCNSNPYTNIDSVEEPYRELIKDLYTYVANYNHLKIKWIDLKELDYTFNTASVVSEINNQFLLVKYNAKFNDGVYIVKDKYNGGYTVMCVISCWCFVNRMFIKSSGKLGGIAGLDKNLSHLVNLLKQVGVC